MTFAKPQDCPRTIEIDESDKLTVEDGEQEVALEPMQEIQVDYDQNLDNDKQLPEEGRKEISVDNQNS